MDNMKVGATCRIARFFGHGVTPLTSYTQTIVRITPKRAYLGDGRSYFNLSDPDRVVLPKYLDYIHKVVSVDP